MRRPTRPRPLTITLLALATLAAGGAWILADARRDDPWAADLIAQVCTRKAASRHPEDATDRARSREICRAQLLAAEAASQRGR